MRSIRLFILGFIILAFLGLPLQAAEESSGAVSLTFQEALGRVADNGRAVRVARQSTAMAHADVGRARSPLLPQLSASAGRQYYAYQPAAVLGSTKAPTAEKDFNYAGVGLYQTIYDFGANGSNLKAARLMEGAASDDARRVRNQTVLEFVNAYFDLLESDHLIQVARDEFSSLASHLKEVMVLWREGAATKNDYLTVRVKFSFARQRLTAFKNQRKIASARLCSLLAFDEKTSLVLEDPAVDIAVPELINAISSALSQRPELKTLEQAARAAEFREQSSRDSDRPTIFADGKYNYAENRYQDRNDNWTLNLGVRMNIFNGGLTQAESAKERAHKEQLLEQKKKAEDDIRSEVEKNYWELKTADEKLGASRLAVQQTAENLRVNRIQYQEGAGTSTAVLDAVALRSSAETDLWRSTYDRKRAWARLLYATGRDVGKEYIADEDPGRKK